MGISASALHRIYDLFEENERTPGTLFEILERGYDEEGKVYTVLSPSTASVEGK